MKKLIYTLTAAVLLGAAGSASAGLVPTFLSETQTGSTSVFVYTINFTSNGSTESLTSGDFFTLYDVGSVMAESSTGSFSFTSQLIGTTAPFTAPVDSASVLNVTSTYNGSTVTADTTYTDTFTFAGTLGTTMGFYSSTDTISTGKNSQAGRVIVPLAVVPEPSTWVLLGSGAVGVGAALRRRSRAQFTS